MVQSIKTAGQAFQTLPQHLAPLAKRALGQSGENIGINALRLRFRGQVDDGRHDLWRGSESRAVDRHGDFYIASPLRQYRQPPVSAGAFLGDNPVSHLALEIGRASCREGRE